MDFTEVLTSGVAEKPSRKKPAFPINPALRNYLKRYNREIKLPVAYNDLLKIS